MRCLAYAMGVTLAVVAAGCAPTPKSGAGFTLPDGEVEAGQATYVQMHCNACHTISGIDQLVAADGEAPEISVALGGEVARIKTYGELVTAVINPSHRLAKGYKQELVAVDGESKMTNYNDVMTVTELTDLVSYLQSNYKIRPYEPTYYPMYGP